MLNGFQSDVSDSVLNQYVTPVRLKTTSFITKTIANDKLIQYTFEIEKFTSTEGNTAVYLQYTYARSKKITRDNETGKTINNNTKH